MDLLVTGAGGFSGSCLVRALLARGHRVTALVSHSRGRLDPSLDRSTALTVTVCDLAAPRHLPPRVDAIVHAAARSPTPGITTADMVRDNVNATANLVAYAATAGVRTFVYLSSLSIYGTIAGPEVDETTPIVNPDTYGMTKLLGELMLRDTSTMRSLSIRLPGILGPNPVRNWLTSVIERGRAGQAISIYNPDAPFNNAIHVDDLCTFIAGVIERADWGRHDAVTVGADGYTSVRDAVDILLRALNSSSRVSIGDEKETSFIISSDKARLKYGYTPASVEAILLRAGTENRRSAEVLGK